MARLADAEDAKMQVNIHFQLNIVNNQSGLNLVHVFLGNTQQISCRSSNSLGRFHILTTSNRE